MSLDQPPSQPTPSEPQSPVRNDPSSGARGGGSSEDSSTSFIRRRPIRLIIYTYLALVLVLMFGWRYLPELLDPTFEKHIAAKRVIVGMSRQQVLDAWGSPYTINVSHTKDGIRREEWIYEDWESAAIIKHRYLYFEEDALVGGWYQQ